MLYVQFRNKEEIEWHQGERFPIGDTDTIHEVIKVEADCDELELIQREFGTSIPFSKNSFQAWYGDIAKSITFFLLLQHAFVRKDLQ